MARLRKIELPVGNADDVPAALKDHEARVWHNAKLYLAWCIEHLGGPVEARDRGLCGRFNAAATAWARQNGYVEERWPGKCADYDRLRPLGITPCRLRIRVTGPP